MKFRPKLVLIDGVLPTAQYGMIGTIAILRKSAAQDEVWACVTDASGNPKWIQLG